MKEMYVVWNMTNYDYGYEFFGICETLAEAQILYTKACHKLGIDPLQGFDDEGNSIMITNVPFFQS